MGGACHGCPQAAELPLRVLPFIWPKKLADRLLQTELIRCPQGMSHFTEAIRSRKLKLPLNDAQSYHHGAVCCRLPRQSCTAR